MAGMSTVSRAERTTRIAECLAQARAGDRKALDTIVTELNPLLWHVVRAQGLVTDDSADVIQTTWLEFLRRINEIRTPEALTGWLVTSARREAWRVRDQRRRSGGGDPVPIISAQTDPGPAVDDRVLTNERDRALWQHFQKLTDQCRELLRIVALVDRPDYDVVAEALSRPRGSIGPTRGRCLAKLRDLLLADPLWEER
jgi:RNA polymerase sigma factor (sigma-70 family)